MSHQTQITRRAALAAAAALTVPAAARAAVSPTDGGGLGTAEAPINLRMNANDAFAKVWQTVLIPEFNKKYPHIKVTIDGLPYSEHLTKTLLDLTGATPAYDLICNDDPWTPQIAQTGALLDLKKDCAAWTDADFDWNDFYAAPLAASEWKGIQYGVPLRSNMLLMFYNRTHYKKAGLPEPTPKLTWAEFMAQAPKLVQDVKGEGKVNAWAVGTYFARDQLTPTIWQAILNSNGGHLLDKDGKAAFNTPAGVASLQTHVDLLKYAPPGAKSYTFNEELTAFRQGQLATMFMWGSVFRGTAIDPASTTLKPDEVGVQVMPVGSASAGTHRGIWSGEISRKTKYPRAAWALLQWMSSKDGERFASANVGSFPARRSTLASKPEFPWLVPVFATLAQSYEVAQKGEMWRPRLAKSDAVQQVLADEVARATSGEISPADALKNAAGRIDKIRL
jgi:ABC-type glycerol-3-phosphate transport system substrate-binding protein